MNQTIQPWVQTYTGKKFWLNKPTFETICIEDIAHSLSMQCRYNGHSKFFYSVAEHSYLVSLILPDNLALAGLLHDAAETYLGDVVAPLKQISGEYYSYLENDIKKCIFYKFDIFINSINEMEIKTADLKILRLEAENVLNNPPVEDWHEGLPVDTTFNVKIKGWCPMTAKSRFMDRFNELTNNKYV